MTRHAVLLRRSTSAGEELSECSSSCSWLVLSSLFVSFFFSHYFFVILCLFIVSYVQMCGQSKRLYLPFFNVRFISFAGAPGSLQNWYCLSEYIYINLCYIWYIWYILKISTFNIILRFRFNFKSVTLLWFAQVIWWAGDTSIPFNQSFYRQP